MISVVSCILYVKYFGSVGSCSYSSVSPPGGGCCTVCSDLAPAEVSSRLQQLLVITKEQDLACALYNTCVNP